MPAPSSTASISGRFEDEATAERERGRQARDRLDGARDQRQALAVPLEHPPDDLVVDLLRRLGEAELVVHVARPLGRAHAHHRGLRAVVPAPAALAHELPRARRPRPARSRRSRRRGRRRRRSITSRGSRRRAGGAAVRAAPCSARSTRPTKSVWSPASCSASERALEPADAPARSGPRVASDHVDARPERDRRHAAGEVLRERLLVGGEQRDSRTRRRRAAARASQPGGRSRSRRAAARARPRRASATVSPRRRRRRGRRVTTADPAPGERRITSPKLVAARSRRRSYAAQPGLRRRCRARRRRGTPSGSRASAGRTSLS